MTTYLNIFVVRSSSLSGLHPWTFICCQIVMEMELLPWIIVPNMFHLDFDLLHGHHDSVLLHFGTWLLIIILCPQHFWRFLEAFVFNACKFFQLLISGLLPFLNIIINILLNGLVWHQFITILDFFWATNHKNWLNIFLVNFFTLFHVFFIINGYWKWIVVI